MHIPLPGCNCSWPVPMPLYPCAPGFSRGNSPVPMISIWRATIVALYKYYVTLVYLYRPAEPLRLWSQGRILGGRKLCVVLARCLRGSRALPLSCGYVGAILKLVHRETNSKQAAATTTSWCECVTSRLAMPSSSLCPAPYAGLTPSWRGARFYNYM